MMTLNQILNIVIPFITLGVSPLVVIMFRMNNKIIKLETRLENKKELFDTIFLKLEENRDDLHQVNTKVEKVLTKLEKNN